ncbi:MAG: M28 family peptidase [Lachnospiraceae bacterium]
MNIQETILKQLDTGYSYRLAKRMEQFRSNEVLGYRPAGSAAEFETGEMLKDEMLSLGLTSVTKDAITVDGWEFKKAVLSFTDSDGVNRQIHLGAYQTTLVTDGPKEYKLCYLGKGTAKEYEGIDVTGKLVLVDINQRDEWWINYPVYQAHLKGAAALIAVQSGGYGEIDEEALNAQDIAGPEDAPAFSISRKDAGLLKALLNAQSDTSKGSSAEVSVTLDADSRVTRNCTTYNITGCLPGKHPDRIILLSAHYDSYFSGFQDDNTAVAMMLGIAKALIEADFQPNNTILFCAMAAEEWGVADSGFDWSTGAYEQVFTAHPEWVGKVIADFNFELPALAHGTRARIRSCYEYTRYLEEFLSELPMLTRAYPEETKITAPIETWSDDFSIAIAGIPSMVNDFTGGSFMETHYHSQFDNDDFYDEQVYRLHHELFALLIEAIDRTAVVPLCFSPVMKKAAEGVDCNLVIVPDELQEKLEDLKELLLSAAKKAEKEYAKVLDCNRRYESLLASGNTAEAEELFHENRSREAALLKKFKTEQDAFVRIDWYGNVLYPHEILTQNLKLLGGTIRSLENGNLSSGLRKLYQLNNNAYAFMFDEEVYRHFTDYSFKQPRERLKWGYGRLMKHENLYGVVTSLLKKQEEACTDFSEELATLREIFRRQCSLLSDTVDELSQTVKETFL